jgi:hypothetical protein
MIRDRRLTGDPPPVLRSLAAIAICSEVLNSPTRVGEVVRILHDAARQELGFGWVTRRQTD